MSDLQRGKGTLPQVSRDSSSLAKLCRLQSGIQVLSSVTWEAVEEFKQENDMIEITF